MSVKVFEIHSLETSIIKLHSCFRTLSSKCIGQKKESLFKLTNNLEKGQLNSHKNAVVVFDY